MPEYELRSGLLVKSGCYLVPINSLQIDQDSYALAQNILREKFHFYRQNPPLLLPLMRGGSRIFLNLSGALRSVIRNDSQDIDYVPIKVGRYKGGEINKEGEIKADENDIGQALSAMKNHEECIIIDDVFDRGVTTEKIKTALLESGKNVIVATAHRKPQARQVAIDADYWTRDYYGREIEGVVYSPWLVYPWEKDDHGKDLWSRLFPELSPFDPEIVTENLV